ncbi:MAG: nicotinate-nucleotide--dimethylbenzimidazole phosphoribosyltransferase [Alphaproteobacteria bacterium]|nr:nicotinate-nucleotide--dimethylbenzimidazole phosphoribosyltransferase [Alphaproteobacteria bacterium]
MDAQKNKTEQFLQGFADILRIIPDLPPVELEAVSAARTYWASRKAGIQESELSVWLGGWQGRFPPKLSRPRLTLFASHHGIMADSLELGEINRRIEGVIGCDDRFCEMAVAVDAELRLFELNLSLPALDFTKEQSMGEGECAGLIVYGMTAVEAGQDILVLKGIGAGVELSAATLAAALGKNELAAQWSAAGDDKTISSALSLHAASLEKPLDLLRCIGGRDIAAIMGAIIAARMGRVPIVLDGSSALIAAALLHKIDNRSVQHCIYAGYKGDAAATNDLCRELGIIKTTPEAATEKDAAGVAAIEFLRTIR